MFGGSMVLANAVGNTYNILCFSFPSIPTSGVSIARFNQRLQDSVLSSKHRRRSKACAGKNSCKSEKNVLHSDSVLPSKRGCTPQQVVVYRVTRTSVLPSKFWCTP